MSQLQQRQTAILVTHSTEVFGPPNALAEYFQQPGLDLFYIDHPLDYSPRRRTQLTIWRDGQLVSQRSFPNWLAWRPINYIKDFVLTVWILWHAIDGPVTYYFGFDSLACLPGIWLRWRLKPNQLIAYNADYSTERFTSRLLNAIYQWADRYVTKHADLIWCVTERIAKIRHRQGKPRQQVIVVPNGVHLDLISRQGQHDRGLVFIGNLTREKGLALLLTALTDQPELHLTIYGDGETRPELEALTKDLGLTDRVEFAGQKTNAEILKLLPNYQIGIALYQASESYVYYSDPLKVKEYLAAGLPVIVTDVPEIAQTVVKAGAGLSIKKETELTEALRHVLKQQHTMAAAALELAKSFDWSTLLTHALEQSKAQIPD